MLKIKLMPVGKKHQRSYKIVVAESRSKVNSTYVDDLGYWYPFTKTVNLDQDKLHQWQAKGAQVTLGVDKLLTPEKYPHKKKIVKEAASQQ